MTPASAGRAPGTAPPVLSRGWRSLRRFLRSPRTIVAEVLAVALAGVVMTAVPQAADREASLALALDHPVTAALVRALALDRVVYSAWFLLLVLLASASLLNVLWELWTRAARELREPLTEASFRATPLRRVIERRARGAATRFTTRGRLGAWGTPVFHLGLFVVVLAGVARALFSADAVAELAEGETLAPDQPGWVYEAHGPLAEPLRLPAPVRLERVDPRYYPSGALEQLSAVVSTQAAGAPRTFELGINAPLELDGRRLSMVAAHGPAAYLTVQGPTGPTEGRIVLLRHVGDVFEASSLHGTLVLRLRGRPGPGGARPDAIELRALRAGVLLFVGALAPGERVRVPGGEEVTLAAVRTWATFMASRDVSWSIAAVGFVLAIVGAALMFTVTRVDTAVVVTPTAEGERVLVALRAQRFGPAFAERFERLVAEESDP